MKVFYTPKTIRNWFEGVPAAPAPTGMDPAQLAAFSVFGLLLLAGFFVLYIAQTILLPAVAAGVTAVIFSPVMRWLEQRGLPSSLAALLIIGAFAIGVAGSTAMLIPTVRQLETELPQMAQRVETKLEGVRNSIRAIREARERFDKATSGDSPATPRVQVAGPSAAGSGIGEIVFQFGLFTVLTFFLLSARVDYRRRFILSQPTQAERLQVARIMRDMGKRVSSYLFTVSLINFALGVCTGVSLAVVGMPLALSIMIGFAIALLNFLPFIGPILVMAGTALISLATFDDWTMIVAPPAIVTVLHLIESQFVSPWFIGRRLEISPIAVFVAIAFLGWIWGAVGAMVAVPILILLYTFGQRIPLLSPLAALIGPPDADLKEAEEEDEPGGQAEREKKPESAPEQAATVGTLPEAPAKVTATVDNGRGEPVIAPASTVASPPRA
jgi:predicted PurR-regulated permease PerM